MITHATPPQRIRPPARTARSARRSGPALGAIAGLVALWLGLSAPAVSPVAGGGPPAVQQVAAVEPDGGVDLGAALAALLPFLGPDDQDEGGDGDDRGDGRGRGRR